MKTRLIIFFLFTFISGGYAQNKKYVKPEKAIKHVGETITVCGKVYDVYFNSKAKGQPTFLNFGAPHPNEVFSVVIWNTDRIQFSFIPEELKGKKICVTGVVKLYKDGPEIIVTEESQIEK